jgi:multiple sugar transport system permease protein
MAALSRGQKLRRREAIIGYLLASPWFVGIAVFYLIPVVASVVISFLHWDLLTAPEWKGLDNYAFMLSGDRIFWKSLGNTIYYSVFGIPLQLTFALSLAVLLNQKVRGMAVFRTIFYLPSVTSGVAVAVLWSWLLHPDLGIINEFLRSIGLTGPRWLYSVTWSKPALIFMSLWSVGGAMIIFLAALQGVPQHLYEAAEVDGATRWRKFRSVTLPMLTPAVFFSLVTGVIGALQVFTEAYVMTGGGPAESTLFYVYYLYNNAFVYLKMGYASAMAWVLFWIILALTTVQFAYANRWVYYEGGQA